MQRRYAALYFPYLVTDWIVRHRPALAGVPFVLATPRAGRMVVTAASRSATQAGIGPGMVVADGRAILPSLQVFNDKPQLSTKLLKGLAAWCIRYTPVAAVDPPDGILLETTGCPHLWGGEEPYLAQLLEACSRLGYGLKAALAGTPGCAWALARFGPQAAVVPPGGEAEAIGPLPPAALRIDPAMVARLHKLGLYQVKSFMHLPRQALQRRFGPSLLLRLDQALGRACEMLQPETPPQPFQQWLPCLEPIRTAGGIATALQQLLHSICLQLETQGKGLRTCVFTCLRVDGRRQSLQIGTTRPSRHPAHLFRLFENKIETIAPGFGIELFLLEAPVVEELPAEQQPLWDLPAGDAAVAELLDRIAVRLGHTRIHRYLPQEHYWPEWSVKAAPSLYATPVTAWPQGLPRPVHLLQTPEPLQVTAPIPDYPPMLFRYKGRLHRVRKADGPERIEQPWWLQQGEYRDYYCVEDEQGGRYWIFRSGDYQRGTARWFIHGFFA